MGYNYWITVKEFLSHLNSIFHAFNDVISRHYGQPNVDALGIPGLMEELYRFVEGLYLGGRKHSRSVQAIYIRRLMTLHAGY